MTTLNEYKLGDMIAHYTLDEDNIAGFILLPADFMPDPDISKNAKQENLVQIKYAGDTYNEAYAGGLTMRNGESCRRLKYDRQEVSQEDDELVITTYLKDDRGYEVHHILSYRAGSHHARMKNVFYNHSDNAVSLEMFESFSMGGITPYVEGDAHLSMDLYRIRSVWSGEGRIDRQTLEDLCLETSWSGHAVRCERYGQAGSLPVNHFFPMGAVYDKKTKVFWGAQIAHNTSWQIEVYRKDDGLGFSGGLADREFGHWMKNIIPGQSFETPEALVSVAYIPEKAGFENADEPAFTLFMQRFTEAGLRTVEAGPHMERDLPIVFNEYCTTWGCPSHENISAIVDAIKDKGISYFVIDCGWYKKDGIPWDRVMGDYDISKTLFPEGLDKTTDKIRQAGMVPGIWFEIDNVAEQADVYQLTDHLLQKDGKPLTTYFRRFWKMTDPWVEEYLTKKVIGTLKQYGFGYMKMDYNESIGIGCDGAESLGEGLRQNGMASLAFIEKVKREIPDIILENCASGGHKLEPKMMSLCAMASFSDAHELVEIPVIAAYLHRVIHPAQSQIWAVIRETDSIQRIVYSMANTLLGRMCLSGDVTNLSEKQWQAIDNGIDFYKKAAAVIRDGETLIFGNRQASLRHPSAYQAVVRYTDRQSLVVVHTFENGGGSDINVPVFPVLMAENQADEPEIIDLTGIKVTAVYAEPCSMDKDRIFLENGRLKVKLQKDFEAAAILLDRA